MAYPARSQALLLGLHHHLIANNRGVDGTGVHLVIRAHPSIVGNAADKKDKRSPKDRPITSKSRLTSSSLLQKLRSIKHHHAGWMIITSRRSNTPSLNNGIHDRLLNDPILKLATRITTPSQIQIRHTSPPNSTNQPKAKQRVPKAPSSQTLKAAPKFPIGPKGPANKSPIAFKVSAKVPNGGT